MKSRIAIFYMIPGDRANGGGSYTSHLVRSFEKMGYDVDLYRIGQKASETRTVFTPGVMSSTVTVEEAVRIASCTPSMIAYSHFKQYMEQTRELLRLGVGIAIHAASEIPSIEKPQSKKQFENGGGRPQVQAELMYLMRLYKTPVVAIRQELQALLELNGIQSQFIPHPYVRSGHCIPVPRDGSAVSVSRVDFAKHTEIICEANALVSDSQKRVRIYGSLNRMFAFRNLDVNFTGWRDQYLGPFENGTGVSLLRRSRMCVDLTYWKGESSNGGSQYTFLEAWDTRTPLVVHHLWCGDNNGEVSDGGTAIAVVDAYHLARVLESNDDRRRIVDAGEAMLGYHSPEVVVPQYARWMGI